MNAEHTMYDVSLLTPAAPLLRLYASHLLGSIALNSGGPNGVPLAAVLSTEVARPHVGTLMSTRSFCTFGATFYVKATVCQKHQLFDR